MEPTTSPETLSEPPDGDDEVEPRPLGMLIVAAIVALAVGGLAGFAIGFKVEQNRVKSKNDKSTTAAAKPAQAGARRAQPAGEVTAVSPTSVTIRNAKGKNRVINVSASTVINKSSTGGATDILQGATVLVQGKAAPDGSFDAAEIVVLPANSKFAGAG
jgi:hypothetical protein